MNKHATVKCYLLPLFVGCFLLLNLNLRAAAVITTVEPAFGEPGDVVQVEALGIDTEDTYTFTVGGVTAAITGLSESGFSFTVPPGALSGELELSGEESGTSQFAFAFIVLREVSGTLSPPGGVDTTGWLVATGDDLAVLPPSQQFTTVAQQGLPSAVWVFEDENSPAFIGVLASTESSITIDATTTAAALIALNPGAAPLDDEKLEAIRTFVAGDANGAALVNRITVAAQNGTDYLDDGETLTLIQALLTDFLAIPPAPQLIAKSASKPEGLEDVWYRTINPPPGAPARFEPIFAAAGRDHFTLEYKLTDINPNSLDWTMEILQLDPSAFPDGLGSLDSIGALEAIALQNDIALQGGFLRATLGTSKLDLFGQLFGAIQKLVLGPADDTFKSNQFTFDRRQEGIYVLQAYSGNVPNGLNLQSDLLSATDPNAQWTLALVTNSMVAALDAASVAISFKTVISSDDIRSLTSSLFGWAKTISVFRASNSLNSATFYEFIKSEVGSRIKGYLSQRLSHAADAASIAKFSGKALKFMAKSIDVLGKISTGAQAVERTAVLLTEGTLAMERTVIVVGDVFKPYITSIGNAQPDEGESITVYGGNFIPGDAPAPTVTFCTFNSTSGDVTASLPANVTAWSNGSVTIKIQDRAAFRSTFGQPDGSAAAFVCYDDSIYQVNSTVLPAERSQVTLAPPPTITSIDPAEIYPTTVMRINGTGFRSDTEIKIGSTVLRSRFINSTQMLAFNNSSVGGTSVTATNEDVTSAGYAVTVLDPNRSSTNTGSGLTIYVTRLDMSNEPDGQISLLEAVLLANGTLGRPVEIHNTCEFLSVGNPGYCGGVVDRETDLVFGDDNQGLGGGPSKRDRILIDNSVAGGTAVLNQTLPVLSWDDWELGGITLDGGGGGFPALTLNGTKDADIVDVIIQNVGGTGIALSNAAQGNYFQGVTIRNSTGDGLTVEGNSTHNDLRDFEILNVGGRGLFVDNSTLNSFLNFQLDGMAGGHGVQVQNNGSQNTFQNFSIMNVSAGDGFHLAGGINNWLNDVEISEVTGNGLRLTGSGTSFNRVYGGSGGSTISANYELAGAVRDCSEWGVLVDSGAHGNVVGLKFVSNCVMGGVRLMGADTSHNLVGKNYFKRPNTSFGENLIYQIIADNEGNGVEVIAGAHHNSIQGMNICGNDGDGVFLQSVEGTQLLTLWLGFQDFIQDVDPFAHPNGGHGIHLDNADDTNIASMYDLIIPPPYVFGGTNTRDARNIIYNEPGDGILIENDSDNTRMVGVLVGSNNVGGFDGAVGGSGIRITTGSSSSLIGNPDNLYNDDCLFYACPDAAISLEGNNTDFNEIMGVIIGSGNIGIQIKDGSQGNLVGRGDVHRNSSFGDLLPIVEISNCLDAGLVIDNAGASFSGTTPGDSGEDPNIVVSTNINNCATGMRLENNAYGNLIGGASAGTKVPGRGGFVQVGSSIAGEQNYIGGFVKAGIHLSNLSYPNPDLRNVFINNTVNGYVNLDPHPDLRTAPSEQIGLLIDGNSDGVVFGEDLAQSNVIRSYVGVYIDGVTGGQLRGCNINNFYFTGPLAGVFLKDTENFLVGGHGPNDGVDVYYLGTSTESLSAGIYLYNSNHNSIQGCTLEQIFGHGITLENSTNNLIGGPYFLRGNQITACELSGVNLIAGSNDNALQNNFVGLKRSGVAGGNTGSGILVDASSNNLIGGTALLSGIGAPLAPFPGILAGVAPNVIANNDASGVKVSGGGVGNQIIDNSIFSNAGLGIDLSGGGNNEIEPPTIGSVDAGTGAGSFSAGNIPADGSRVQLFSDADGEGQILIGEAFTNAGGVFSSNTISFAPFSGITVTVTDATTGDTSEFGTLSLVQDFRVTRRLEDAPGNDSTSLPVGTVRTVLPLKIEAVGIDVLLKGLTFDAAGSLDDLAALSDVSLWRDLNDNGLIDQGDQEVASGASFDADNGELTFDLEDGISLPANSPTYWVVGYAGNGTGEAGDTFSLALTVSGDVDAAYVYTPNLAATPTNPFPVASDNFTLTVDAPASDYLQFQTDNFPNPGAPEAEAAADYDGDGIPNYLEWLLQLDPVNSADSLMSNLAHSPSDLSFEIVHLHGVDATVRVMLSSDLSGWATAPAGLGTFSITDNGDGTVTLRFVADDPAAPLFVQVVATELAE